MGECRGFVLQEGIQAVKRIIVLTLIVSILCTTTVFALPAGVKEVKDPKTGETRYRLKDEQDSDPRTYTYEQMMQEEEGYEPEGIVQYDRMDDYHDPVSISNISYLQDTYDDGYDVANLKVYLSNYLYYFTLDDETVYHAQIIEGSMREESRYGGILTFSVTVDEFPDMEILCEYHKKFKLFGFESVLGDMSLEAQFVISKSGRDISRESLTDYANGTLGVLMLISANKKREPVSQVWINDTTWEGKLYAVNGYFMLDEGVDETCLGKRALSESDIETMLLYLQQAGGDTVHFISCQKELESFYEKTHVDVAAMLAIILAEGTYNDRGNGKYWNFYNMPAPIGGTVIPGTELWDAKSDCKTVGEALVASFQWIYQNYWLKGQDSYYKMSFNRYGFPQTGEEADSAPAIEHSYSPWFLDRGYISSGFDDYYAWCNRCARSRRVLEDIAE